MNIELIGKDVQPSKMLKGRIENKLGKIERRLGHNLFVRVKLDASTNRQFTCGVHFQGIGQDFNANATSDDLIKAADEAMQKIERQVTKAQHRGESKRYNTPRIEDFQAEVD